MGEVQDLSHNIGSMSIYEKLARIQEEVMNTSFSKSGENKFQKYDYFELEDLLQKIIPLTIKYETTIMFSFTEHGVLKLKDWNPEKGEVSIRVPFPELEAINRGTNKIQSTGAYITYLKRYLLMNMFLIMEKDIVDSNTNNAGVKKETNTSKKEVDVDEVLNKIKAHIHKKDSTIPITPVRINLTRRNMLKKKEIDEVESKAVFEWFKKQEKEAKT
ncbi:ERF family protein [Methanobrevibacter smithii]|uniref:ERF family protein n=1 Tax=Methanobrevibacter smithii TaxID=2173 RepID=UPI0037DD6A78